MRTPIDAIRRAGIWLRRNLQLHALLGHLMRVPSALKLLVFGAIWVSAAASLRFVTTPAGGPLAPLPALYQGAQFFVLSGPGIPTSGPPQAVWSCTLLLFLAPAVTGGILLDVVAHVGKHLLGRPAALLRWKGHAVVAGYGTHGAAVVDWLVAHGWNVAVLDRQPRGDNGWMKIQGALVPTVCGELADVQALAATGLDRAALVVIATRDQVANLGAVQAVRELRQVAGSQQRCTVIALVDDKKSMEPLDQLLADAADASLVVRMIDRSDLATTAATDAATKLQGRLNYLRGSQSAPLRYRIAVVGAGRYGRALIQALAEKLQGMDGVFDVVDTSAPEIEGKVKGRLSGSTWTAKCVTPTAGGGGDEWIDALVHDQASLLAVFLCVDDDMTNLLLATKFRARLVPDPKAATVGVVLRTVKPMRRRVDAEAAVVLQDGSYAYDIECLVKRWLNGEGAALATAGGQLAPAHQPHDQARQVPDNTTRGDA